jgi:hypothetical protein
VLYGVHSTYRAKEFEKGVEDEVNPNSSTQQMTKVFINLILYKLLARKTNNQQKKKKKKD